MRRLFWRSRGVSPTADVSVVIPVYNHERFVADAIHSVLQQTIQPREIICIDDGSTDGSARHVEALAAGHPIIRFWSRANRGAPSTLNEGIQAASGRYVAILNSDDLFHPDRLARCLAVLEADPQVHMVASRLSFVDGDGRRIRNQWYEEALRFYRGVGDLGLALVNGNFLVSTSNIVARRSLFDDVGTFDELRYAHDLDLFLRIVVHGKRLTLIPASLLTYRVHGRNTISESHRAVRAEWGLVAAFFARRLASGQGGVPCEPAYLARLLEVAEGHRLTRLVALSLLHLWGAGKEARSPGACLADPGFRSILQEEGGRT